MIEPQILVLLGVALIEIGLIAACLKLKASLDRMGSRIKKFDRMFSTVATDMHDVANTIRRVVKGIENISSGAYDLKVKGNTPFGNIDVSVDLEREVM